MDAARIGRSAFGFVVYKFHQGELTGDHPVLKRRATNSACGWPALES